MSSRFAYLLCLIIIALCLIIIASGCATTYPADLDSLQRDPMAQLVIPGTELVRTSERDASLANKPVPARLSNSYRVLTDADPAVVHAEAIAQAERHEWDIEDPDAEIVQGTKRLETGNGGIAIYFIEEEGEQRLLIRLAHEWTHPTVP
jgi:hypothetical protein